MERAPLADKRKNEEMITALFEVGAAPGDGPSLIFCDLNDDPELSLAARTALARHGWYDLAVLFAAGRPLRDTHSADSSLGPLTLDGRIDCAFAN